MVIPPGEYQVVAARDLGAAIKHFRTSAGVTQVAAAEAVERWGAGSPALSVGLPIGAVIGPRDMRGLDFFENILPEGPTLQRMAAMAGVRPADTYGILKAFGRDCAGAIQLLPEGEEPGDVHHGRGQRRRACQELLDPARG
ncbi:MULTISPECIES: HipA N-terminal domain-containing protein [unclassified Frankia]|uniref:HipA N-terminal domain-containing protein n=1 Tax=unclassified Frankia TaxID=2632575 RepID=UPI002024F0DF